MNRYLIYFFLLLPACTSKTPKNTSLNYFEGIEMTIPYHITVGHFLSKAQKKSIEKTIEVIFHKIDLVFNNYNPHSEISLLATLPAHKKVMISPELRYVLQLAQKIYLLTEGKFDPTVEPLAKAWKKALRLGQAPQIELISEISKSVGWHQIHLEGNHFSKDHDHTAIDLGGIAKGYCVDLLLETLSAQGFRNLYVEWGGEVRVQGMHPDQRKWRTEVAGVGTIEMSDEALATSGNYVQYWTLGGITYTHIIDPKLKTPLQVTDDAIASVSVMGKSCAEADALATALMLFESQEKVKEWAEANTSARIWTTSKKAMR